MLTTGFSLAILSTICFYFLYRKLPKRIKRWMVKHAFITDVMACLLTYWLFGSTLTALIAAAIMGIIVSIMLALLSNPVTEEALELFSQRVQALQKKFVDFIASQIPEKNEQTA